MFHLRGQMVGGARFSWAESRLSSLTDLLEAATGGLTTMWTDCGRDREVFVERWGHATKSRICSPVDWRLSA